MNTFEVFVGVLLFAAVINGRHMKERGNSEHIAQDDEENFVKAPVEHNKQVRHPGNRSRRHSYRSPHGRYNSHNNENLFPLIMNKLDQMSDRFQRRHDTDDESLLPLIMNKLEEISNDLKYLPRPQIIYVPVPILKTVKATNSTQDNCVDVGSRVGEDDGKIFFPKETTEPKTTTANPIKDSHPAEYCDAVIINCCRRSLSQPDRRRCFTEFGCGAVYAKGDACSYETIQRVLKYFRQNYGPKDQ